MKKIIKTIAIFIALIMITYNMCFADVVAVPVEDDGSAFITDLIIPSFFILGMSLVIIEVVAYIISKKKKAEETDKIEDITYKTSILVVLFWILFIISSYRKCNIYYFSKKGKVRDI